METKLILIDGTELDGHILPNGEMIFVYLMGMSLAEGFAIFSDKARIARITERIDSENEKVFEGFTQITSINTEFGNCNLTLRRE